VRYGAKKVNFKTTSSRKKRILENCCKKNLETNLKKIAKEFWHSWKMKIFLDKLWQ
jgi:hypothetical protein